MLPPDIIIKGVEIMPDGSANVEATYKLRYEIVEIDEKRVKYVDYPEELRSTPVEP